MPRGENLKRGSPAGDAGRKAGASLGGKAHSREHMARIGKAGWKKLIAKHGIAGAAQHLIRYRLDHPSSLERTVMDALDGMGVEYVREKWIALEPLVIVDFLIGDTVIEVDGGCHNGRLKDARWQARRESIIAANGLRLVRLDEAAVNNGLRKRLEKELGL